MIGKLLGEFPRPRTIALVGIAPWALLSVLWIYRTWTRTSYDDWFVFTTFGVGVILALAALSNPPVWIFGTRVVLALRCLVIAAIVASAIRFRSAADASALSDEIVVVAVVALLVAAIWLVTRASGRARIDLHKPVDGDLIVTQGGRFGNHHKVSATQRWAADILALGTDGRRAPAIAATHAEEYVIFGLDVHAPCDGVVAECADGRPDNTDLNTPPTFSDAYGNFVAIATDENVRVVLAHLQDGSIAVREGDRVTVGQVVGRSGNSGRTTEPHLHLHCESDGVGVPFTIDGHKLYRGARLRRR
ncbi:M23 family metallopeptidase [Gordonia sp. X0973]|uniref:M23 family metallopeptidase n=1 Tax=Gordonia sp. X0973 TaxID=2742602 RepID=UPI000F53A8BE|nr:M23 family metallopeptidase [Gordonia sp. X0973]QKT08484.1 M23 family metallopeptidase [Gordonia sp. X0973]